MNKSIHRAFFKRVIMSIFCSHKRFYLKNKIVNKPIHRAFLKRVITSFFCSHKRFYLKKKKEKIKNKKEKGNVGDVFLTNVVV